MRLAHTNSNHKFRASATAALLAGGLAFTLAACDSGGAADAETSPEVTVVDTVTDVEAETEPAATSGSEILEPAIGEPIEVEISTTKTIQADGSLKLLIDTNLPDGFAFDVSLNPSAGTGLGATVFDQGRNAATVQDGAATVGPFSADGAPLSLSDGDYIIALHQATPQSEAVYQRIGNAVRYDGAYFNDGSNLTGTLIDDGVLGHRVSYRNYFSVRGGEVADYGAEAASDTDEMLAAMAFRSIHPDSPLTDDDVVTTGRAICADLDAGVSLMSIALDAAVQFQGNQHATIEKFGTVMGVSIPAFCPNHLDELEQFNATFGG
jgi:hypothetical protein